MPPVRFGGETLGAFLDDVTAREPHREAVAHAPRDHVVARMTRAELRAASRLAAKKLVSLGVRKGTRVGFLCPNRLEWLPIAFGALRIGAILLPFSTLWKREEIEYGLVHADVELLITVPRFLKHDYLAALSAIAPEAVPALRRIVHLDGEAGAVALWADAPSNVDDATLDALEAHVAPSDPATVFFTSGTTAQAKAVVHAHGALAISARRIADCLGTTPDDAWWGHMPLFWSGGFIIGALQTLAGGGRIVLQEQVDAGSALALLEAEGCTIMAGWHQAGPLMEHPDWGRRKIKLRKGSNHPLADRLMGPDHVTVGMYGMSETATCVACARWDDPPAVRRETFGRPLAGMEIRIVDPETGRPAAPGEPGEIFVKGPTLMEGYYRVPPSQTFDRDGFFKTGDLGYLDDAGCLHFATRLKDVIKTAGVNVAAVEVEEALAKHPGVKAAHVVGVPDAVRGENVAAFVVLEDGAAVDPDALQAFCKTTLASYKVPRHVFLIAETDVPRTGTGKIEKPALKKMAQARKGPT
jgi:fatty-acyl-CoA synthase